MSTYFFHLTYLVILNNNITFAPVSKWNHTPEQEKY